MNPTTKPTDTLLCVFRGGCWYNGGPSRVRAASRNADEPAARGHDLGFRCALPVRQTR